MNRRWGTSWNGTVVPLGAWQHPGRVGRLLNWLRSSPSDSVEPGQLVTLTLGTDIYRANLVAEACAAQGLRVELLTSEMGAHPHTPGAEQRLLIRSEDLDAVREVLAEQDSE